MRLSDAALHASGWPDSRAYWRNIGRLVDRLEVVNLAVMGGIEGLLSKPTSQGGSVVGDPTATQAMRREQALAKMKELEAERGTLIDSIGSALVLVEGVRAVLGHKYADVLELRYIDRFKWASVASDMGMSARHAQRIESVAHDWIDSHGWGALIMGRGQAE